MKKNIWLDGMMGVVVGDALGCPVQFLSREEIKNRDKGLVTGMESGGVYNMPEGTWTDDSSMAIAGCVMGGTSMVGGLASIGGTVIGVFIISLLQQGILALGIDKNYQLIITGIIVIVAVYADVMARRRKN